jgi:hypothetical protein
VEPSGGEGRIVFGLPHQEALGVSFHPAPQQRAQHDCQLGLARLLRAR